MRKIFYTLFVLVMAPIMMLSFTVNVNANEQWEQTGSGTVYYAVFPSGYYTGSTLYGKYNGKRIEAYQNSETKKEVATTQSGWIYWHWTFNNQALPNDNYNVFISDHKGWDEGRNYIYFSDFESSANFPEQDKYGNKDKTPGVCFYHWRNIVSDGSWWWFRIPVYKQTYTEYKKVQSQNNPTGDDSSLNNNSSVNQPPAEGAQQSGGALSDATVTHVDIPDCVYNGKNRKPKVSVVCNGKILVEGVDFSVEYKNCKKIGKATVIIKGCGNYSGTIKRHYKIVPNGTSIKKCQIDKKKCTIKWKKKSKNCNGYIIRYSTDPSFASCKKKVVKGKNKTKCTIKGIAAGTTYYIQICSYKKIGKKKYCSGWSNCKTVTTKKQKKNVTFSTSELRSTVYTDVVKKGSTAYCVGSSGLYKVKLKKGRVKSVKRMIKFDRYEKAWYINKKGKYIYLQWYGMAPGGSLGRINIKTGKKNYYGWTYESNGFVIVGNRIYYDTHHDAEYKNGRLIKDHYWECTSETLNGKDKKSEDIKLSVKWKKSNVKKYRVITKDDGDYKKDYIKTPKGTFYLGKVEYAY
ncbi:MAG: hypothetical protein IKE52_05480 [Mogibacterium sp.]|nr:hypothetical protein [Mogibacterium sp.]